MMAIILDMNNNFNFNYNTLSFFLFKNKIESSEIFWKEFWFIFIFILILKVFDKFLTLIWYLVGNSSKFSDEYFRQIFPTNFWRLVIINIFDEFPINFGFQPKNSVKLTLFELCRNMPFLTNFRLKS